MDDIKELQEIIKKLKIENNKLQNDNNKMIIEIIDSKKFIKEKYEPLLLQYNMLNVRYNEKLVELEKCKRIN